MADLVASWIPTQEEHHDEEGFREGPARIASGHLTLIDVLLDLVPADDGRAIERMLAVAGMEVPMEVAVIRRYP